MIDLGENRPRPVFLFLQSIMKMMRETDPDIVQVRLDGTDLLTGRSRALLTTPEVNLKLRAGRIYQCNPEGFAVDMISDAMLPALLAVPSEAQVEKLQITDVYPCDGSGHQLEARGICYATETMKTVRFPASAGAEVLPGNFVSFVVTDVTFGEGEIVTITDINPIVHPVDAPASPGRQIPTGPKP